MFRRFRVACATRRADKLVHFLLRECSRRESAAVDAVYHYDLPCEKANQENPQIFLICKYKNNFSDEFAQSNAEGISNRPAVGRKDFSFCIEMCF